MIRSFRESRQTLQVPDFSDAFTHKLYGTFLSYLAPDDFAYDLTRRTDPRGALAEFVKSEPFGQLFVSRTKPGITRGNHYHHARPRSSWWWKGRRSSASVTFWDKEVIEYRVRWRGFSGGRYSHRLYPLH